MTRNDKPLITKILPRGTINNNNEKKIRNFNYLPASRKTDKRTRTNNNYNKIFIINVAAFNVASKKIRIEIFAIFIKKIDQ